MALEWTITAAVGLMVGISVGMLIELKYIIKMDRKMTHLIERTARIELRTEHEILAALKKRGRSSPRPKRKAAKKKVVKRKAAKKKTKKRR